MLELKINKSTKYVTGWKFKVLFEQKFLPLNGTFISNVKQFGHEINMQFNNTSLVLDQNKIPTKIVNAHIVHDLDNCPNIPFRHFILKNFLFDATNIAKNSDKSKWAYSCIGIAFDGNVDQYFANASSRNVVTFGVDNSSPSGAINYENGCLVLDERDTFGIFGGFSAAEKRFTISFSNAKTNFCLSSHYSSDNK